MNQTKPDPTFYQIWIEYEDVRKPLFRGNADTLFEALVAAGETRETILVNKEDGEVFIHQPK